MKKTTSKTAVTVADTLPVNVEIAGSLTDINNCAEHFAQIEPGRHTVTFVDKFGINTLSVYWDGVTLTL